jgi:hypothetical protein
MWLIDVALAWLSDIDSILFYQNVGTIVVFQIVVAMIRHLSSASRKSCLYRIQWNATACTILQQMMKLDTNCLLRDISGLWSFILAQLDLRSSEFSFCCTNADEIRTYIAASDHLMDCCGMSVLPINVSIVNLVRSMHARTRNCVPFS